MAEHVEDIGVRLSTLETRVEAEVTAVQQHFTELQQFVTFSLTRQSETLRTEWREDLRDLESRVNQRFDLMDRRFGAVDRRFDAVDGRFDALERGLDVFRQAMETAVREILSRLPTRD